MQIAAIFGENAFIFSTVTNNEYKRLYSPLNAVERENSFQLTISDIIFANMHHSSLIFGHFGARLSVSVEGGEIVDDDRHGQSDRQHACYRAHRTHQSTRYRLRVHIAITEHSRWAQFKSKHNDSHISLPRK